MAGNCDSVQSYHPKVGSLQPKPAGFVVLNVLVMSRTKSTTFCSCYVFKVKEQTKRNYSGALNKLEEFVKKLEFRLKKKKNSASL